jgi:hypothetical protein
MKKFLTMVWTLNEKTYILLESVEKQAYFLSKNLYDWYYKLKKKRHKTEIVLT